LSGNPPARITEERIRELIAIAQNGGASPAARNAARNAVITAHMWLVHKHVKAANRPELRDDLTQACIADTTTGQAHGLIRAVELFDLGAAKKFSTYADAWIRRAIANELAANTRGVAMSGRKMAIRAQIIRTASRLERTLGRVPSVEEVHAAIPGAVERRTNKGKRAVTLREVRAALTALPRSVADLPEDGPEFSDGQSESALVRALDDYRMAGKLADAVAALPERERLAVRAVFGLGQHDGNECTMKEVGALLGVSATSAKRDYCKGLALLREALTSSGSP
jgi:RNA polymerase sigma factor (sigma-70 family)